MDDRGFDNIARRVGDLRSRRAALKIAGCGTVAAVFAALGLENSALAQDIQVGIEANCLVRGERCEKKKQCCGGKKNSKEIVCKTSAAAGTGLRCCGQAKANCLNNSHCCDLYFCNAQNRCTHV